MLGGVTCHSKFCVSLSLMKKVKVNSNKHQDCSMLFTLDLPVSGDFVIDECQVLSASICKCVNNFHVSVSYVSAALC